MNEQFTHYFKKVVVLIKEIVDDSQLSDEEKVRLLGMIL